MSAAAQDTAGDYLFPVNKLRRPSQPSPAQATGPCSHTGRQEHDRNWRDVVLVACGSFNPPTAMHMRMFELAAAELEKGGCSVLGAYMSPVGEAYGKAGLASGAHRLAMCVAASASSPLVMVDSWEVLQPGYTRTLMVLRHVQQELQQQLQGQQPRVLLLCGADVLASMAVPGVWKEPEVLLEEFGVVCLTRDGTDLEQLLGSSRAGPKGQQQQQQCGGEGAGGCQEAEERLDEPAASGVHDQPAGCSGVSCMAEDKVSSEQAGLTQMFRRFRSHITLVQLTEDDLAAGAHTLSSSKVRALLQSGGSVAGLVPAEVEQYIQRHGLYVAPNVATATT